MDAAIESEEGQAAVSQYKEASGHVSLAESEILGGLMHYVLGQSFPKK